MTHLSIEAKEAITLKAVNRSSGESVLEIAKANNIGYSTLQRWVNNYKSGKPLCTKKQSMLKLSPKDKLEHIIATSSLDESSLGKYCRKHGLYSHQLEKWRLDFMTPKQELSRDKDKSELKKLKAENKHLQRELRRKEKALAEASALLILKKKAELIWGVEEDD